MTLRPPVFRFWFHKVYLTGVLITESHDFEGNNKPEKKVTSDLKRILDLFTCLFMTLQKTSRLKEIKEKSSFGSSLTILKIQLCF